MPPPEPPGTHADDEVATQPDATNDENPFLEAQADAPPPPASLFESYTSALAERGRAHTGHARAGSKPINT